VSVCICCFEGVLRVSTEIDEWKRVSYGIEEERKEEKVKWKARHDYIG